MDYEFQLDLQQLRSFVAAAESGSMSAAAARVGLSQPSLSQQIKKLEAAMGVDLFDRVARGVIVTEAGAALLPRAQHILSEVQAAASAVRNDVKQGVGRLRVGAIPTIAPYLLPGVIARLRERYPKVELFIKEDFTERLLEQIDAHELDVVILSTPIEHERVDVRVIGDEPLLVVVPAEAHGGGVRHDHAGSGGVAGSGVRSELLVSAKSDTISLGELRPLPRVSLHEMHCLGRQIDGFCAQRLDASTVVCKTTQLATVLELVRLGMGVSIVPAMAAEADQTGTRRYLAIGDAPSLRRNIAVATRRGRTASVLTLAFVDAAVAAVNHEQPTLPARGSEREASSTTAGKLVNRSGGSLDG